ncbi:NBAS subunit of NRZ tethering complex isoform X1 [Frankliniella occidentalis]|uniref:NBAS subunit of NRZ tethering complex isoform X1 n=1 Tax=Frankliniella occidentalis TaxID=133901 RepID=A0A6J1SV53_FRAOC|nr:NBAS subunit of NRZ tethering complex isoform X1 [Frankliniella occidentalis]
MDESVVSNSHDISSGNSILYELFVYSEWKLDPELPKRLSQSQEGFTSLLKSALTLRGRNVQSEQVQRLLTCQQPWRLCVGDGGKVVAIIQDSSLEIRSSRDAYSSVIAKASLPKDPFSQWRRWCWSPDCTMLAVGFSNGTIRVYDLMGCNLFSILPEKQKQELTFPDTANSFATCFFLQPRTSSHKWSSELVTVDYNGLLHSYLVSPTEGFQENHSFSFASVYRNGITSVAYHPAHSLLFVAGPVMCKGSLQLQEFGDKAGITAWRILNDHPFYQIVHHNKNENLCFANSMWKIPFIGSKNLLSYVVRMEVSPCATRMAALHSCGEVSLWSVPGIRLQGFWPLINQPDWNIQNPLTVELESPNGKRSSNIRQSLSNESFYPIDLDWWSEESLVLVRNSGAVSVCEISSLQNLLGESPEFLAGPAQVKRFQNEKGFLALECDVDILSNGRNSSEEAFEEDSLEELSDDEAEDEAPVTVVQRVATVLNAVAYLVTDLERFRPKRRRLKLCRRTYRLLALRSTTPEELYSRKLDNEEYGEALTLAHAYNLDCDLVYQRQWRNNKVSVATIRDYLSKVSNQTWVLRECLERVPESLLAARELLEFGLKATSKESFRNLSGKRKVKDVEDMTDNQKEFLVFRHTLLRYKDRLTMFEKILGGLQLADELFEHMVYADFRSSSSLRACVQFARASNCQAVECMLTYQSGQTLHHWLPILSNFPETVCPMEYKSLLPELSPEGVVFPWQKSQLREPDWSEKYPYENVKGLELETPDMDNKWLYEHEPGLSAFRVPVDELTPKMIQQWYVERIRAIERSSRMVDNALILLRLAQDNNIEGLVNLHQELQILDSLVYELFLEDISLADLEKKSPLEKGKLLMSKTSEDSFISDMNTLLLPYLDRLDKEEAGMKLHLLHSYLVSISNESLLLPLKFFEGQDELATGLSPDELSTIAVDCIYSYVDTNDLHLAQAILITIPVQRVLTVSHIEQLDSLELELAASVILQRNGTPKSLGYIRDNKHDDLTVTQLLIRVARTVASSNPSASEAVWISLLNDLLDLQKTVFNCVTCSTCYEIFCSTLLSSGSMSSIKLAGSYLNSASPTRSEVSQIAKEKCVDLVLSAAREYMDSAGTLTDPSMELARACLYLLPTEDLDIQEERNLLSAFQLLHDFGMRILPIQVRLYPDRLRLVEECLKKKSGAHRNSSKLLQLAAQLNIHADNPSERQGRVLVLVAEAAFSASDFRSCAETCNRLVAANYTNGWSIASTLAKCAEFKDLSTRAQLLSFALHHCPPDMLQELVNIRRTLEMESLQQVVKKQIVMHNSSLSSHLEGHNVNPQQSESAGLDLIQSLSTVESSVQETTQRLLSCVGDSQFWKKALRIGWDESIEKNDSKTSKSAEHHICHAFYSSLYKSTAFSPSKLGCSYDCFSAPDMTPQLQLEQALLRISLLEQESEKENLPNVLTECALSLLSEDYHLGMGYLLSLPKSFAKEASHRVFEANISTVNLQLAQYYSALQWYSNLVKGDKEKIRNVFLYNPKEVVSLAQRSNSVDDPWQNELLTWRAQLGDYVQAQDLLTLDCGVDVNRFASDDQYRHDSILGLAMNEDSERLRFALALATRHGVDRAEVVAEHVSNLLLSGLPESEVKHRLSDSDLNKIIQEAPEVVKEKLETSVFSHIDGKQINLLELYYTILNQVAPSHRNVRLLPKDHLKLLGKVKATTASLDYKLLISGPKQTIKAVESSLTVDNIPLVAKLLKAMPSSLASPMTASQLYAIYLKRQLLVSSNVSIKPITPLLVHIKGEDIIQVIESVLFTDLNQRRPLSNESAEELIAAALLHCEFSDSEKTMEKLACWKDHIRNSRWLTDKWPDENSCKDYYLTYGEKSNLINFLHNSFFNDNKSVEFLVDLLKVISTSCNITEDNLILDIFKNSIEQFERGAEESLSQLIAALSRIEQLSFLGKLNGSKGDWEQILRPLAMQEKLSPDHRLKVFNILQQSDTETTQEPTLLLSHTKTILASSWPQITVANDEILDEEKRSELFLNLIQNSASWQQRDALRSILDLWPPFSRNCQNTFKICSELLLNSVVCDSGKWTEQKASYIVDIFSRYPLSYSLLEQFLSDVQKKSEEHFDKKGDEEDDDDDNDEDDDGDTDARTDVQLLILICLLSEDPKAHRRAVALSQQQLMVPFQERVAELAIAHGLTADLLSTPAYSDLVSGVLFSQPASAENIVETLIARKHIPEAGSVILRSFNSVPRFMRTFSASIIAGLKGTNSDPVSPSHSRDVTTEKPMQVTSLQLQSSVMGKASKDDNEWDASENEWSDVEEGKVENTEEPFSAPVGDSVKSCVDDSVSKPCANTLKADGWGDQDGWDNWSDEEELEKIDSEKKSREKHSRGEVLHQQKHISPPLLPSPQSAFARVPPRELGAADSPVLLQAKDPEDAQPSDWDEDDWGAGWET